MHSTLCHEQENIFYNDTDRRLAELYYVTFFILKTSRIWLKQITHRLFFTYDESYD